MAYAVPDHHVLQFSENVALLSQQKMSKLEIAVTHQDCFGEGAQLVNQYGTTEFADLTDPKADTAFDSIDISARWVFPSNKKNVLPVTREDQLRTIYDNQSPLVMAQAAALGRLKDTIILAALSGKAKTGKYDSLADTALPATQKLGGSTVAFSLDLCKDAQARLNDADVPQEDRFAVISPKMARILLDDPEFTSSDYNTSKALSGPSYEGLQGFLGFSWIVTTQIPDTTPSTSKAAYFFHKSGISLGIWNSDGQSVFTRITERSDKNYITQVYSKITLGASRVEEVKVVTVENTADYA